MSMVWIVAVLPTVLNFEVKVSRRLPFNPIHAVRLVPEERQEAARFLPANPDWHGEILIQTFQQDGAPKAGASAFPRGDGTAWGPRARVCIGPPWAVR